MNSHETPNRGRPVWVRPPKPGTVEHYSGQSRAKLLQWESQGKIIGGSLKEPKQKKGVHVFLLQSVLDHIESMIGPIKVKEIRAK